MLIKIKYDDFYNIHRLNSKDRITVRPAVDKTVHLDYRALHSLLESESVTEINADDITYTQNSQTNKTPLFQNILSIAAKPIEGVTELLRAETVGWLHGVCQAEACDPVVFPLTISLFDRILATKFIPRKSRQALASACLFLASKVKAPNFLFASKIVYYTDDGVSIEELQGWEMFVLNHLDWKLFQPTPFEFYDVMMTISPILERLREDFITTLHKMQLELSLSTLLPSWQASICLLFVAIQSRRQYLIRESENCIRQHIRLEPNNLIERFLVKWQWWHSATKEVHQQTKTLTSEDKQQKSQTFEEFVQKRKDYGPLF